MTAAITSPVELALGTVLHHAAGGATTATLLHLIATATQQAMGTTTAFSAVILGDPDNGLTVHATSPDTLGALTVPVELLVSGPAQTKSSSGAVSTIEDVRTLNARWTPWSEQAAEAGVVGVRCWPVRVSDRPIGALVVLTPDPWSTPAGALTRPGSSRSNAAGQALADVASVALQLPTPPQRWAQVLLHLHTTIHVDAVVHQAVGMVAAAQEIDIPTAAAVVAAHAACLRVEVTTLARQVVARTVPAIGVHPS